MAENPTKNSSEENEKTNETVTNSNSALTNSSLKSVSMFGEFQEENQEAESFFLKRKVSSASVLEVEIPSFLHDKKNRARYTEKVKEDDKEKEEVNGNFKESFNFFRIRKRAF
jgi:hypothetical protein